MRSSWRREAIPEANRQQTPLSIPYIVLRSLRVSRFRTVFVMIAVAVVVGLLFSTIVLEDGVGRSAAIGSERLGADMMLLPAPLSRVVIYIQWKDAVFITPTGGNIFYERPSYFNDNGTIDRGILGIQGVAGVSRQVYVDTINFSNPTRSVHLIGFDPKTDFTILPWLGTKGPSQFGPDIAIAGSDTGFSTGQSFDWDNVTLKISGVLDPTNTTMDQSVFFPIDTAYAVASQRPLAFKPGDVSALLIKLQRGASQEEVSYQFGNWVQYFTVLYGSVATRRVGLETNGIATYEFFIAGLLAFSVLMLIASLISMTVNERKGELGLIRSLGATRRFVSVMILSEIGIISILGGVVGLAVGSGILFISETYLTGAYSISLIEPSPLEIAGFMLISLLLGLIIGAFAASYPAYAAGRLDPYDAIRRGE